MYEHEAYRFCPKCGGEFASRLPNVLRCDDCAFSMYLSPKPAIAVVLVDPAGLVGLSRRAMDPGKGGLDPVGGFVDRDESMEQCAARELQEETGLSLSPDRLHYAGSIPSEYLFHGVNFKVFCPFMAARITDEEKRSLVPNDDVAAVEWFHLEDLRPSDFPFLGMYDHLMTLRPLLQTL